MRGDHRLFVREDELKFAWDIFTPVLQQLEKGNVQPIQYPFGSRYVTSCVDSAAIGCSGASPRFSLPYFLCGLMRARPFFIIGSCLSRFSHFS